MKRIPLWFDWPKKSGQGCHWHSEALFGLKAQPLRYCAKCGIELTEENSSVTNRLRVSGTHKCRTCCSKAVQISRGRNPEPYRATGRRFSRTLKGRFKSLRDVAKRCGRVLEISFEEYVDLIRSGVCGYCGEEFSPSGYALDRINHDVGYLRDNLLPCCRACNQLKGRIEGLGFRPERCLELFKELLEQRHGYHSNRSSFPSR